MNEQEKKNQDKRIEEENKSLKCHRKECNNCWAPFCSCPCHKGERGFKK